MATTYKYRITLVIREGSGSKTLYPIIEAPSENDAKIIAKAQFPNCEIRGASKVN